VRPIDAEDHLWDTPWAQPLEPAEVHTKETRPRVIATDAELTALPRIVIATALIAAGVKAIAVVGTGPVVTADAKVVAETRTEVLVGTVEKKTNIPQMIEAAWPTVRPMIM
jgi:hypothetical protein